MAFVLGMRGTNDWADDMRPKSWRDQILYLYPDGDAPLTAMLAKLRSEKVSDPEFYWWTKTLSRIGVDISDVYTEVTLSSGYSSGAADGTVLYVKMAEDDAKKFRAGHEVLFRASDDSTLDAVGKVVDRHLNGDSSFLAVKLLEADDNSTQGSTIANADRLLLIGNLNAEGAEIPEAIARDPVKLYNYTQIWRTSLEFTRTALQTKLRTGDQYQQAKAEALEAHSIEIEMSTLFGIRTEKVGNNGKPERTTMGMLAAVKSGAPGNIMDYRLDDDYSSTTWVNGGEEWLDSAFETLALYGSMDRKVCFAGAGALRGIMRLAKKGGQINLSVGDMGFGLKTNTWITPFGSLQLITHPLFNYEPTLRHAILFFEPKNLVQRIIQDTDFFPDGQKQNTGHNRIDGIKEEFLTELGLEYHFPETMGIMYGVGADNTLT